MRKLKLILWKAKDGWRWHMKRSGRIVAESGEAYARHSGAQKTLDHILKTIQAGAYTVACLTIMAAFTGCNTIKPFLTPEALTTEVSTGIQIGLDVYPKAAPELAIARDAICANASNGIVDPQQIVDNLQLLGITNSNTKIIVDGALLVYEGIYTLVGSDNTAKAQPYIDALCAGFTDALAPQPASSRRSARILPPHLK